MKLKTLFIAVVAIMALTSCSREGVYYGEANKPQVQSSVQYQNQSTVQQVQPAEVNYAGTTKNQPVIIIVDGVSTELLVAQNCYYPIGSYHCPIYYYCDVYRNPHYYYYYGNEYRRFAPTFGTALTRLLIETVLGPGYRESYYGYDRRANNGYPPSYPSRSCGDPLHGPIFSHR